MVCFFPSTDAQELGNYFEFICTGSKARDGHTPEQKMLKSGKVATDYLRMDTHKYTFIRIINKYGFKITDVDFHFDHPKFSGIADIIAKDKDGKRVIIDIKSSGLINDKYNEFGWGNEGIEQKDKLLVQAVHYKILAKNEWGIENMPFYFFIFSTKNETDCKIFEIQCDADTLLLHENNFNNAIGFFKQENEKGWEAKPELKRCGKCPLKEKCEHFTDVPQIQKIYY